MSQEQGDLWKQDLINRKKRYDDARKDLNDALRRAVELGESYTLLGSLLGQSNAAVRLKARRNGWDADRRKPRVRA